MKKALFLLLFFSVGQIFFPCRAEIYSFVKGKIQRNDTSYVEAKEEIETDKVYQMAEKMPEFPGGKQRLLNWMKENIQYPVEAQKEGIQGRVIITFVINKSGKAVEPLIVQSVDSLLDKEAIRLINSMPKWKPGEEKGEPVRVKLTLPINFRLSGGRTEGTPAQEEEVLIYQYDPIADKGIGFVNSKGEIVIPGDRFAFVYESRLDKITFVLFNEELKEKGFKGIYAINRKGEPLFEVYCFDNGPDYVEEGLFRIIENNKIGFANMNGEVVIKPQFDFVWPFQECGYAVFNMGGKKVIYDTHNNYSTWEGGKWGIINKKGEIVLPPTYEGGYSGGFIIDDKRVPIEDVLESTLTKLTNKVWDFLYFDGDDDEEDVRAEFSYSTTEASVHVISNVWDTTEVSKFYLSDSIVNVFDDSKIGKINNGKYIILKDVFEDGHTEVTCEEILELTDTTLTIRDIEEGDYSFPTTLYRK